VERLKTFFTGLGFEVNPEIPENEQSVALLIGDNLQVMLLTRDLLKSLAQKEPVDAMTQAQMTIALTFESRDKVNEISGLSWREGVRRA
jgi:hypothetical protein